MRYALRRGMCPVGSAEGVIHINITKRSKLLREFGIVFLFFLVVSQILQKKDLTGLQGIDRLVYFFAYTIFDKKDAVIFDFSLSERGSFFAGPHRLFTMRRNILQLFDLS